MAVTLGIYQNFDDDEDELLDTEDIIEQDIEQLIRDFNDLTSSEYLDDDDDLDDGSDFGDLDYYGTSFDDEIAEETEE